jgi:hypothetical protein
MPEGRQDPALTEHLIEAIHGPDNIEAAGVFWWNSTIPHRSQNHAAYTVRLRKE